MSHNHRGMTSYCSAARVVEIRDTLESITDQRKRVNKSPATLIREKIPPKAAEAERKTD